MKLKKSFHVAFAGSLLLFTAASCSNDDNVIPGHEDKGIYSSSSRGTNTIKVNIDGVRYNGLLVSGRMKWLNLEYQDDCFKYRHNVDVDIHRSPDGEYMDVELTPYEYDLTSFPGNTVLGKISMPEYLMSLYSIKERLYREPDEIVRYEVYSEHGMPVYSGDYDWDSNPRCAHKYSAVIDGGGRGIVNPRGEMLEEIQLTVYYFDKPDDVKDNRPISGPIVSVSPKWKSADRDDSITGISFYGPYIRVEKVYEENEIVPELSFIHSALEVDGKGRPDGGSFSYSDVMGIFFNIPYLPGWDGVSSSSGRKSVADAISEMKHSKYMYADDLCIGGYVGLNLIVSFLTESDTQLRAFIPDPYMFMYANKGRSGIGSSIQAIKCMPANFLMTLSPYLSKGLSLGYRYGEITSDPFQYGYGPLKTLTFFTDTDLSKKIFMEVFMPLFENDNRRMLMEVLKSNPSYAPYAEELTGYLDKLPEWIANASLLELGLCYKQYPIYPCE